MDYWNSLDVVHHADWKAFKESERGPERIWLFTTRSTKSYWDVEYRDGDGLLFGKETAGCPEWLREEVGADCHLTIPQYDEALRSLNLSTSVGIAAYEALRQGR